MTHEGVGSSFHFFHYNLFLVTSGIKILPGFLHRDSSEAIAGAYLTLFELWHYPLPLKILACAPKSIGYALALSLGA